MESKLLDRVRTNIRLSGIPITLLSRVSGIARPAIVAIRDGSTKNPGVLTVDAINRALDQWEAEQATKPTTKTSEANTQGRTVSAR